MTFEFVVISHTITRPECVAWRHFSLLSVPTHGAHFLDFAPPLWPRGYTQFLKDFEEEGGVIKITLYSPWDSPRHRQKMRRNQSEVRKKWARGPPPSNILFCLGVPRCATLEPSFST